jgi:3-isopropylmalate/(R)-2-methylmalate dehydratase small subunit
MKKTFGGPAIVLDRSDINTDEIIPAKYLTEVTKEALKPYCLEDLKLEGFDANGEVLKNARVVVTRENFGCGSSREHAPWVFEVNDIHTVIAESYARIFRQNMFNCGMLAIELPKSDIDALMALEKMQTVRLISRCNCRSRKWLPKAMARKSLLRLISALLTRLWLRPVAGLSSLTRDINSCFW